MKERNKVFITGASGLLGRSLVQKFTNTGWFVFAHYHNNRGAASRECEWLQGDFSTIEKTERFIEHNRKKLNQCMVLINNYGPITYKKTINITSSDLNSDIHGNLIVANEMISFLLRSGNLKSVVNVGYEGAGEIKPYKKILPYAIAKAGLLLLTESYDKAYPDLNFSMINPPPLTGGEFGISSGEQINPEEIADTIFRMVSDGATNV